MIRAAVAFFVLAVVAFIFGANGIAGVSVDIGKMLLFVFLMLAVISFAGAMLTRRPTKRLP